MIALLAALLFALLILVVVVFQIALVAGMPWGEFAWGGAHPGRLPVSLRLASAFSILLLLAIGAVVLARAGILPPAWLPWSGNLIWAVVAYCALGVVANAITPSRRERIIWLPVAVVLLVTSAVVAAT